MSKRTRTRETLFTAALELFDERGYEATTVAEIARRAGVTEMTFFRHFPSKDAVLVDDPYDPLIADAIVAADPALPALAAVTAGVRDAWASVPPPAAAAVRERLRIVAGSPALRGALARNSRATEQAIAEALRCRGVASRPAVVVAAAAVAALNGALLDWAAVEGDESLGDAILGALAALDGAS
ncbi:MAG TPA: helix-turn-helix domain-containing protein [Pseudolysinimonas sp.]|nr:helix-turn-helix domain-containing protein [Pseudolysinimonas sp.]